MDPSSFFFLFTVRSIQYEWAHMHIFQPLFVLVWKNRPNFCCRLSIAACLIYYIEIFFPVEKSRGCLSHRPNRRWLLTPSKYIESPKKCHIYFAYDYEFSDMIEKNDEIVWTKMPSSKLVWNWDVWLFAQSGKYLMKPSISHSKSSVWLPDSRTFSKIAQQPKLWMN